MDATQAQGDRRHAAVGYLRRSTDQQEQSLDDQRSAIQQYLQEHGLHILRWYTDDAISGTRSASGKAFQAMIADAQKEDCLFSTIVVYDIKRFGRIDNDEAGPYRWILRQHGVRVVYVAEHFVGDTLDDLIRPVKQWQAREESRDLSRVTIRGLLSKVRRDLPGAHGWGGFHLTAMTSGTTQPTTVFGLSFVTYATAPSCYSTKQPQRLVRPEGGPTSTCYPVQTLIAAGT